MITQRLTTLARTAVRGVPVRHGSSGGLPPMNSARWAHVVRNESNVSNPEDPPTAHLSENHEVNHGVSDFSNWVDRHDDVSLNQALTGLSVGFACMYGIYRISVWDRNRRPPLFTKREMPTTHNDIPTMAGKHFNDVGRS